MKRWLVGFILLGWVGNAGATVSIEFQFGSLQWPKGATGLIVADTAGDGFVPVASAVDTVLAAGQTFGGGDDRIVAVFSIGDLADWSGKRGFAVLLEAIDYASLGVSAGQAIKFVGLPARSPGQRIRAGEPFGEYSTGNPALISGNMGFVLPPDSGAYQLAVLDALQGGAVTLTEFGSPLPDMVVEVLPNTSLANPATVNFGSLYPGVGTVSKTLRIKNTGRAPLTGLQVLKSGTGATSFQVEDIGVNELASGASVSFSITFDPPAAGNQQASLSITSNDIDDASWQIALTGTALDDPRLNKPFQNPGSPQSPDTAPNITQWTNDLAGTYDGLIFDQNSGELAGALANLVISKPAAGAITGGTASGTLRMNGRSARIRGVFNSSCLLNIDIPQSDGSTVKLEQFQLARITATDSVVVRGTVTWNDKSATVDLLKSAYNSKTNLAPSTITGRYTMLLPSEPGWGTSQPGGDGWATTSINVGGAVAISGVLGDGTKFTESALLSKGHQFSIYADLYRSTPEKGRIGGRVTLRPQHDISDFDGQLQWKKFSDSREVRYATGFALNVWALGSRYSRDPINPRTLPLLAPTSRNAELSLIGPSAPSPAVNGSLDRVLTWLETNRLVYPGPEKLSGTSDARNGKVSGTYTDPATKKAIPFSGVVFQKQNLAGGVFVNGARSGALRILPGTY